MDRAKNRSEAAMNSLVRSPPHDMQSCFADALCGLAVEPRRNSVAGSNSVGAWLGRFGREDIGEQSKCAKAPVAAVRVILVLPVLLSYCRDLVTCVSMPQGRDCYDFRGQQWGQNAPTCRAQRLHLLGYDVGEAIDLEACSSMPLAYGPM